MPRKTLLSLVLVLTLFLFPSHALSMGNLGSNLGGVNYYDGQVVFADITRQGGEWLEGENFPKDARGWPLKVTSPLRMALAELSYPAGTYRVSWRGDGSFLVGGKRFSGKDGAGLVYLDGESLVLLEITSSNQQNHLRNIRVLVPGARSGQVFRARYLTSLKPYRALRFMDWQKTNGTFADPAPTLTCQDALRANYISQGRRAGVSVVWMVRLANRLRANPWFTVPHKATSAWLRCHGRYVKNNLRPTLLPRYEFSNETWNPAFEQYHDMENAGIANGLGGGDPFLAAQLESARRHIEMTRILRKTLGNRPWRSVLAGQAANSWVLEERLSLAKNYSDEIAIAPYMHLPGINLYDPLDAAAWSSKSVTETLTRLRSSLEEEVRPWIKSHMNLGKPLLAYEGGQHLAGFSENDALTQLLIASNRDNRMGDLYRDYLALWKAETGNRPFMHFLDSGPYSRYGSWGALENTETLSSPKYNALLQFRFLG